MQAPDRTDGGGSDGFPFALFEVPGDEVALLEVAKSFSTAAYGFQNSCTSLAQVQMPSWTGTEGDTARQHTQSLKAAITPAGETFGSAALIIYTFSQAIATAKGKMKGLTADAWPAWQAKMQASRELSSHQHSPDQYSHDLEARATWHEDATRLSAQVSQTEAAWQKIIGLALDLRSQAATASKKATADLEALGTPSTTLERVTTEARVRKGTKYHWTMKDIGGPLDRWSSPLGTGSMPDYLGLNSGSPSPDPMLAQLVPRRASCTVGRTLAGDDTLLDTRTIDLSDPANSYIDFTTGEPMTIVSGSHELGSFAHEKWALPTAPKGGLGGRIWKTTGKLFGPLCLTGAGMQTARGISDGGTWEVPEGAISTTLCALNYVPVVDWVTVPLSAGWGGTQIYASETRGKTASELLMGKEMDDVKSYTSGSIESAGVMTGPRRKPKLVPYPIDGIYDDFTTKMDHVGSDIADESSETYDDFTTGADRVGGFISRQLPW